MDVNEILSFEGVVNYVVNSFKSKPADGFQ